MVCSTWYGPFDGVGGSVADSQALKADALDFLGDGLIRFSRCSPLAGGRCGVRAPR